MAFGDFKDLRQSLRDIKRISRARLRLDLLLSLAWALFWREVGDGSFQRSSRDAERQGCCQHQGGEQS